MFLTIIFPHSVPRTVLFFVYFALVPGRACLPSFAIVQEVTVFSEILRLEGFDSHVIRIPQGKREDEPHRHYYTHQKKVPLIKDNNKLKDYHAILGTLKAHTAVKGVSVAIYRKL